MTMFTTTAADKRRNALQGFAFSLTGVATILVILPVFIMTAYVLREGASAISWEFIFGDPIRDGREGGFFPVIILTLYVLVLVTLMAVPVGVACAIYLAEYARAGIVLRFISLTIVNLAGVPSIVYGLFGAALFLDVLGQERVLWVAAATLAVQALAIIITASREALLAVPQEIRLGSLAMGISKLQTTVFITLPQATQGIITGCLLAISRAAGETAPILIVGAIAVKSVSVTPEAAWTERAQWLSYELYIRITQALGFPDERKWGLALVLLFIVFCFNISALILRYRIQSTSGSGSL